MFQNSFSRAGMNQLWKSLMIEPTFQLQIIQWMYRGWDHLSVALNDCIWDMSNEKRWQRALWNMNYLFGLSIISFSWVVWWASCLPSTHRKVIKLIKCKTCIRRNVTCRVSLCLCKYVCYFKEGSMHLIFFYCMLSMCQAL